MAVVRRHARMRWDVGWESGEGVARTAVKTAGGGETPSTVKVTTAPPLASSGLTRQAGEASATETVTAAPGRSFASTSGAAGRSGQTTSSEAPPAAKETRSTSTVESRVLVPPVRSKTETFIGPARRPCEERGMENRSWFARARIDAPRQAIPAVRLDNTARNHLLQGRIRDGCEVERVVKSNGLSSLPLYGVARSLSRL